MMRRSQFHYLSGQRRLPIGAEVMKDGVDFRVWAPLRKSVDVLLPDKVCYPLTKDSEGYFSGFINQLRHGDLYQFRLDEQDAFGDPASRFQPQGVHGPSQVIDPDLFSWTDQQWKGLSFMSARLLRKERGDQLLNNYQNWLKQESPQSM